VNNLPDKTLVLVPHRLFSLWDMNQIVAKNFLGAWSLLEAQIAKASAKHGQVATEADRTDLDTALNVFEYQCLQLKLMQSRDLCRKLHNQLTEKAWHTDESMRQAVLHGFAVARCSQSSSDGIFIRARFAYYRMHMSTVSTIDMATQ
jgi:hypothetical protein